MTPEAALYRFLSGFGIPAYMEASTPDEGSDEFGYPYLTYNLVVGDWLSGEVNVNVNVFYKTSSEAAINSKVREIGDALGIGGVTVPCEGGMLWFKKGSPWAQSAIVEGDTTIKRRYLNMSVEYLLTED